MSFCRCSSSRPGRKCPCGCASGPQPSVRLRQRPLVEFAQLRGLIYRKRLVPGGRPRTFIHFFQGCRPRLVRDPSGRRLYILGGNYRITPRGIEG